MPAMQHSQQPLSKQTNSENRKFIDHVDAARFANKKMLYFNKSPLKKNTNNKSNNTTKENKSKKTVTRKMFKNQE